MSDGIGRKKRSNYGKSRITKRDSSYPRKIRKHGVSFTATAGWDVQGFCVGISTEKEKNLPQPLLKRGEGERRYGHYLSKSAGKWQVNGSMLAGK